MYHKRLSMIAYALVGLLIISISINFGFKYLVSNDEWLGLLIGVLMMLVSIVIYQFGKMKTIYYQMSFVVNMIGVGLSMTAYYVLKAYSLTLRDFLAAILISILVLIGFALFSRLEVVKKHVKTALSLIIIISFILSLALWLSSDLFTGLTFYYLNVIYFFMIGVATATESFKDISREMAWVSFGAFILVSIIVLIVLTEGEALTGLDGFDIPRKKRVKK